MPVKMSICYQQSSDLQFDQDYFTSTHIPLVRAAFEPHGLRRVEVSFPVATPNSAPPRYRAVTDLHFDHIEAMKACMRAAGREVMMDVQNYTNTQPESIVSTILELD